LWGSFYYDDSEDAKRIVVKHRSLDKSVEWLKYEFIEQNENSATVALLWENRLIAFKIEADVHQLQLASFQRELKNKPGFNWLPYVQAARYCLDNNLDLNQAMIWSDQSINERFGGQKNFQTLSTKAEILSKMGKSAAAEKLMTEAITKGGLSICTNMGEGLLLIKNRMMPLLCSNCIIKTILMFLLPMSV